MDVVERAKLPTQCDSESSHWFYYLSESHVRPINDDEITELCDMSVLDGCWDTDGCLWKLFDEEELEWDEKLREYLEYIQTDVLYS